MRCPLFRTWLQSLALTALTVASTSAAESAPGRWAVILAPGQHDQVAATPQHANAGRELARRLEKAGFKKSQIVVLADDQKSADRQPTASNFRQQLEAVRDAAQADDVILIAVAAPVRTVGDADVIVTRDAQAKAATDPLRVAEIVQTLKSSASKHRVLVVDSAEVGKKDSEQTLGQKTLGLPEGQWAIFNGGHRVRNESIEGQPLTYFMQSVLDGLASLADGNRDGEVSVLELTEYMQLYAETQKLPAPHVHGKTTEDFKLATISSSGHDEHLLPSAIREKLARRLYDSASVCLFVEDRPLQALESLRRAALYRPESKLAREIDTLTNTALSATGQVEAAWKRAQARSEPLFLRVNGPVELCLPGQGTGPALPRNIYIKAVSEASSETQKWLYVTAAYQPRYEDHRVSFIEYPLKPGMIRISEASQLEPSGNSVNAALQKLLSQQQKRGPIE